jgi:hypothetical protein
MDSNGPELVYWQDRMLHLTQGRIGYSRRKRQWRRPERSAESSCLVAWSTVRKPWRRSEEENTSVRPSHKSIQSRLLMLICCASLGKISIGEPANRILQQNVEIWISCSVRSHGSNNYSMNKLDISVKRLLIVKQVCHRNSNMRWLRIYGDYMFPTGKFREETQKIEKIL